MQNYKQMKPHITTTLLILQVLVHFTACTCSIEKDAHRLAAIRHERTELIVSMLKTTDSAALNQYNQELQIVESRYTKMKKTYDNKYSNPSDKVMFDTAYAKALKEINAKAMEK